MPIIPCLSNHEVGSEGPRVHHAAVKHASRPLTASSIILLAFAFRGFTCTIFCMITTVPFAPAVAHILLTKAALWDLFHRHHQSCGTAGIEKSIHHRFNVVR